ncbi:lipoate-protein ligase B [Mizugakiibacter sediminis]|uniref:Octanoyltransferase n=1 Tax=Mizugakiibacter sediminis TaxID=1475481 RepID=A0A0K8QP49_9GAMM|nr:lipoyl(octanoyl) transferase LipB [Mizugakiibacter sediminis]GAP66192.1 lipoate-protein ligase B [Mizugakiibacter sediminis]
MTVSPFPSPVSQFPRPLLIRRLGRQRFETTWRAMEALTDARDDGTPDELWLLEHEPVFTLGQAGKPEHLLAPGDIPVVPTNRGGQVTYHGPGQIVGYPLFDLRRLGIGVREFVRRIEQVMIDAVADWNIVAERREGAPGIYVAGAKIGALGLRVRHGCTFHGLALNVAMDLEPFQRINPCGYKGLRVAQVLDLGGPSRLADVEDALVREFCRQFGFAARAADPVIPHSERGRTPASA